MSWWDKGPLLPSLTVFESEKAHIVIYDHNGQPYARPKTPMGFIDPNHLPASDPRPTGQRGRKNQP